MTHLAMTLSKLASTGEPQEVFVGSLRPDGRVSVIVDERPDGPEIEMSAAVEIDRAEAIRLIDHLRQVFGIGLQELREIQV